MDTHYLVQTRFNLQYQEELLLVPLQIQNIEYKENETSESNFRGKDLRNRRGLSSVIGSIFFIIVFTSAATYVVYSMNQAVSPGQTLTKVGQNLNLVALPTQAYDISLVTDRGNTKEILVNSASLKPIILQLFVLPEKVSTGFSTTLLFAVTNNMSNNGALTNLVANLTKVVPQGASATRLSGPEPAIYPFLAKGDTAYFKWAYTVTGNSGQGINFTASLKNGYLGNVVSRNVTINAIQGIPAVKNVIGGGFNGTISSSSTNFLRFFGDNRPSTTYNLKSMSMPMNGTFKNLYVNKGTGTGTATLTLYQNSVGTSLGVTSCTTGTTCSDTTHSVSVIAGDTVAMAIRFSNTQPNGDVTFSIEFDPN